VSALRSIRPTSLRQQATGAIRASILSGEIKPGEIWSAPGLARRLGVSATPVREAMLELASHGIVESVRNRGFRVIALTRADLDELLELRRLVEVPLAGRVAGLLDAKATRRLRALADRAADAASRGDLAAFLAQDLAFHLALLAPAGNAPAIDLLGELGEQTRLHGLLRAAASETLQALAAEHGTILEAALAGSRTRTEAAMRRHLDHVGAAWRASLAVAAEDAGEAPAPLR
jgi:DNA-binding GntR family transcriptional regulator